MYVVATPIGNLADISLRALEVLGSVDLIAAEDTRHTRKLLSHYNIHKPLVSYHSQNMQQRGFELVQKIIAGERIALVTDAGTPGISDPGSLLIRQSLEQKIQVISIPGAAALITALVTSGLPTQPFAFLGFPPNRGAGRKRFFQAYAGLTMTSILYESPQRLKRTLSDLLTFWGDRRIAVARELTKKFEEQFRGTITEAQSHFAEAVKGEITLVVAGAEPEDANRGEADEWVEQLEELLADGKTTVKEAAGMIAAKYRISRRDVYQKAIQLQRELGSG